jgi:alginate O-acetyltransferase complex protein AlgI
MVTFVLVYFAWIFFRANNTSDAFLIIKNHFNFSGNSALNLFTFSADFYIGFICIAILLGVEYFEEYTGLYSRLKSNLPGVWKWAILLVILLVVLVLGEWHGTDFLYFQF